MLIRRVQTFPVALRAYIRVGCMWLFVCMFRLITVSHAACMQVLVVDSARSSLLFGEPGMLQNQA